MAMGLRPQRRVDQVRHDAQVQYHDIKDGETWKGLNYQTVLTRRSEDRHS